MRYIILFLSMLVTVNSLAVVTKLSSTPCKDQQILVTVTNSTTYSVDIKWKENNTSEHTGIGAKSAKFCVDMGSSLVLIGGEGHSYGSRSIRIPHTENRIIRSKRKQRPTANIRFKPYELVQSGGNVDLNLSGVNGKHMSNLLLGAISKRRTSFH